MKTTEITKAILLLEKHDYQVLRPHVQVKQYHEIGEFGAITEQDLFYGKAIDCEANGVHHEALPFEIGCVVFRYDDEGHIYDVTETFTMFEDINEPILDDVKKVTGRTDADIEGKAFDEAVIGRVFATPGLIIAHNAQYDRPKLEKRFQVLQKTPWACSYNDIPWMNCDVIDKKLRLLCMDLCGFHFKGHFALNDSYALLDLLNTNLPTRNCTIFQQILLAAKSKTTRLWAIDAPYEKKDYLKANGFRWDDSGIKANYIDVPGDIAPMLRWLEDNIYPYPINPTMMATTDVTAFNRYSYRIHPSNKYLRHVMPFGKHRGSLIVDVANKNPDYLEWCLSGSGMNLDADLAYTFKYYLQ